MFKRITGWFRRKSPASVALPQYVLPSDDPEISPIPVEDASDVQMAEVASLNSRLLSPVSADSAGWSVRTRAVVEMKNGLGDLGSHVRSLGQRLQAQTMGQQRLLEALTNLPLMLRDVIPSGEEQTKALAAMKLALDEQADANRQFVDALKPLPEFVRAAANLPETARKQMWALEKLTEQLEAGNQQATEHGQQVKVLVESLTENNGQNAQQMQGMVEQLTRFQRAQLKQQAAALRGGQAALASQRKHQIEMEKSQQSRLSAIAHTQAQSLHRLEENFRRSTRMQLVVTAAAALLAILALAAVAFVLSTANSSDTPPQAEVQRHIPAGAVVSK